jgi:uncharacterized protein YkwD
VSWRAALSLILILLLAAPAAAAPRAKARRELNQIRAEHGCGKIAGSRYALRKARAHSRQMADRGEIFHSQHLQQELSRSGFSLAGEVVGQGPSWRGILRALLRSRDHRRLLLDCSFDLGAFGFVFRKRVWLTGRFYAY